MILWKLIIVGKDELSDQQRQSFEDYFQSLYSHYSSTVSSNHPTLIQIGGALGVIKCEQGKYDEARSYFEKVFTAMQTSMDPDNPMYNMILSTLASAFLLMNDDTRAEQLLKQVHNSTSTSEVHFSTLQVSADLFEKRGDWQAAITCYKDLLQNIQSPSNSMDKVSFHRRIAFLLFDVNDFDGARSHCQAALDILQEHQSYDHPEMDLIRRMIQLIDKKTNPY